MQYVDTIAVVGHHLGDAAHLPLDTAVPVDFLFHCTFGLIFPLVLVPYGGIYEAMEKTNMKYSRRSMIGSLAALSGMAALPMPAWATGKMSDHGGGAVRKGINELSGAKIDLHIAEGGFATERAPRPRDCGQWQLTWTTDPNEGGRRYPALGAQYAERRQFDPLAWPVAAVPV